MSLVDKVTIEPSSSTTSSRPGQPLLVFYIAGNPGLIGYYRDFLYELQHNLKLANEASDVTIHGASAPGFELDPTSIPITRAAPPYSLAQQIQFAKESLSAKVKAVTSNTASTTPLPVVLVAHSVGAYILLEILAWWQQQPSEQAQYRIVGGINLFPTVVDIARSDKGRQLSWFLGIPSAWRVVQFLAHGLACVPTSLWNWPATIAPGDLHADVTEALVRSRYGVGQVLYMAADEMRTIREDKWPDELWGVREKAEEVVQRSASRSDLPKTKLYFYWGTDDYWVDNKIRDDLITQRANRGDLETEDFPQMRVDGNGIPHTFSLNEKDCSIVAREVADYICQIKARCRKDSLLV